MNQAEKRKMQKKKTGGASGFAEVSKARLGKAQSREMLDYVWTPYADIDDENIAAMARCNMAHTLMLYEQRIIARREAARILKPLSALLRNRGTLKFDSRKGDLFFNVEAYVIGKAGADAGGKMHIGRSRIDLIAALMRLKVRKSLTRLISTVMALRRELLRKASTSLDVVMPAYTHLQPAQVTTFGHYLVAFYDAATRDLQRLLAAFDSTNVSPLGAAASSGTSWPLDRERVAELLGFAGVVENTKDAAHNYDWFPECMAASAIFMSNVSRVATDFYIWCSHEFSLIELDGAFAASSSIMPQKKNPYSLEMIRARTGEITSAFGASLEILKGDTGGTAFDIKLTGPRIADNSLNRAADMAALITPLIRTMILNKKRMLESAGDGFTTAVTLADTMVEKGLSFRTAHHIVGRLVRMAAERKFTYRDVTPALVNEAAREITGHDLKFTAAAIRDALDPTGFVESRKGMGGPARAEVKRMLARRERDERNWQKQVASRFALVESSERKLAALVARIAPR
jgi:argininosuccinate lyase